MQKTLRVLSLLLIIAGILSMPFAASAAAPKSLKLGKVYKDTAVGFQVRLPKGWKTMHVENDGTGLILEAIDTKSKSGANINMQTGLYERDFETEIAEARIGLPQLVPGYQLIEDRAFKVKGAKGWLFGSTFPIESVEIQTLQLFVMKGQKAFIITAAASTADFKHYKKFFLKVFKTFRPL